MAQIDGMRQLLAHILNCGYMDMDYILELFENFDVEYDEINFEPMQANEVIYQILDTAVTKAGIDQDKHKVSIYTNCLDSHLHIDDEEVYSKADLDKIKESETTEEETEEF
jgi:hypothetical protein